MKAVAIFEKHGKIIILPKIMIFSLSGFKKHQTHAIHIHEFGDTSNGCDSLGGHYNPTRALHGAHAGDLFFNFTTDKDGEFSAYIDHNFPLEDLYGRSIVIHKRKDDLGLFHRYYYLSNSSVSKLCGELGLKADTHQERLDLLVKESQENGNSGKRIDCAIIARASTAN